MNILAITTNDRHQCMANRNIMNSSPAIRQNRLDFPAQYAVSFTGKKLPYSYILGEVIRDTYESTLPRYRAIGTKLLDTLEVISNKFSDRGVSFDRKYCEESVIKGTDSFMEKLLRSGESPYDRIRSTLYVENPYDFKLIKEILAELKLRGYELRTITETVNGGKVKKPDFDIRLQGVTQADTKILGPELQKCIAKPLKTWYEDIQMRLVDTSSGGRQQQPLEVLILYGKNYAQKAKKAESYYSYYTRRLMDKRLHIAEIENPSIKSPAYRVQNNIGIISDILINNISRPLFYNGKMKDFHHENKQLPVKLSKDNCVVLKGLINGICNKISEHYRSEIAKVSSNDYIPQIEKLIKNSSDFKLRADKTIYIEDIKEMRKQEIKRIKLLKQNDLDVMKEVKERINETIEAYGEKD